MDLAAFATTDVLARNDDIAAVIRDQETILRTFDPKPQTLAELEIAGMKAGAAVAAAVRMQTVVDNTDRPGFTADE